MATKKITAGAIIAGGAAVAFLAFKNRKNISKVIRNSVLFDRCPNGSPRLPKSVIPAKYDIFLAPDLVSCTFEGIVDIDVEIKEQTKYIVLNLSDIDLADQSIKLKSELTGKDISPASVTIVAEDEILILKFDDDLPLGKASLHIKYEGKLNDQMKGFYRSKYTIKGEQKNMAVTQFEPSDARKCFPCWDEPAFKATFVVTLEVPKGLVALSNMPVVSETPSEISSVVKFQESPLMSTYLVAIVVGEFDYIQGKTDSGLPIRVYTEKGKQEMGDFALNVAKRTLPFFARYFGTPYPLPKIDMVAIPDFAAGAMENYGLVTYRAAALLVDPKSTAAANKQRIAIIVTHELAHQWFGNLVTMEWWTHLWLNEGFASWVSYLAVNELFPEWNIWPQFLNSETSTAFRLDALQNSHPIEVEVGHVREIDEIFDAISYSKGASVIRMLQSFLGAQAFQAGLSRYIARHAYSNASTVQLWESLGESTGESVSELMSGWTKQMGYPVLSCRVLDSGDLEISQERYLSLGVPGEGEWVVPLTGILGSYEKKFRLLMKGKTVTVPIAASTEFVKLNEDQTGFYRVHYSPALTLSLVQAVKKGQLSPSDRFGLLDDAYALSRSGKQSLRSLLSLVQACRGEKDPTVMTALCEILVALHSLLQDALPHCSLAFDAFAQRTILETARLVGWSASAGESHLVSMLRGRVVESLVQLAEEATLREGRKRFSDFLSRWNGGDYLLPDLRKAAYRSVLAEVSEGDTKRYSDVVELYRKSDLSEEKNRILGALGSGPPVVLKLALDFLLTSEVRPQDAIFVLGGIGRSGREVAWTWLKENWDQVYSIWGEGFLIGRFVLHCCSSFCSEEKAVEIRAFFQAKDCPPIKRTVEQCVERIMATEKQVKQIRAEEGLEEFIAAM